MGFDLVIVAIVGRKGGIGKTTSAVHLAGALALAGRRVLLVDLDPQASASRSLGVARHELAPSIHDVLFRDLPAAAAVRATGSAGLDLITASADLIHADLDLATARNREERLRQALEPLIDRYDWIFLDSPPALSTLTMSALVAADGYVIPSTAQPLAFDGVDLVVELAERLRRRFGRPAQFFGLLLTMVDRRNRATFTHVAELRMRYGLNVFDAEIPINVRLAEAPAAGATVFETSPRATGAHAYRLAAVELAERAGLSAAEPEATRESPPEPAPRTAEESEASRTSEPAARSWQAPPN